MTQAIENQVAAYATAQLDSVAPVSVDEVLATRGKPLRITTGRIHSRLTLVGAVAVSIVVVVIAFGLAGRSPLSHGSRPGASSLPGTLPPTTTAPTTVPVVSRVGTVCGYEDFVGGPPNPARRVPPAAVAPKCPITSSTSGSKFSAITITAANGRKYLAYFNGKGLWSARLPAGAYHAVGWGCVPSSAGDSFVVKAGRTLTDVRVYTGCDVS